LNSHQNIQYLFSTLSVSQIRGYLTNRGWRLLTEGPSERLSFERTFAGGEHPATVWIWSSVEHRRFRNQVPNLIFSLSVLESRPALDIANEMFAEQAAPPKEPAAVAATPGDETTAKSAPGESIRSTGGLERLVLRFAEETSVTVAEEMLSDTAKVAAGDVVELVHSGGPAAELQLEIAAGSVKAILPKVVGLRLLQGVAKPMVGPHWSAVQIVTEELGQLEDVGDSKQAALLLEELGPTLTRIDFELDVNAPINDHQQSLVLRQTAVLAAALSRRLPESTAAERVVWRACAKLLFPVGRRLQLSSTAAGELLRIATGDEELRPAATLAWLRENTQSVAG
jgi:hypothetical protein